MDENEISRHIVDAAFQIHREIGPGPLESVYEAILTRELAARGLTILRQQSVPIRWRDITFDEAFRADLIVNDLVIVEIKSVVQPVVVFKKQLLTYLRLTNRRLGILLNFGEELFKDGVFRVVNGLGQEQVEIPTKHEYSAIIEVPN